MYESAGWTHCDDHLYSALAKHSLGHLGIEVAVAYYVKLLKNQHRKPVERQVLPPIRTYPSLSSRLLTYAHLSSPILTYPHVC